MQANLCVVNLLETCLSMVVYGSSSSQGLQGQLPRADANRQSGFLVWSLGRQSSRTYCVPTVLQKHVCFFEQTKMYSCKCLFEVLGKLKLWSFVWTKEEAEQEAALAKHEKQWYSQACLVIWNLFTFTSNYGGNECFEFWQATQEPAASEASLLKCKEAGFYFLTCSVLGWRNLQPLSSYRKKQRRSHSSNGTPGTPGRMTMQGA